MVYFVTTLTPKGHMNKTIKALTGAVITTIMTVLRVVRANGDNKGNTSSR